MKKILLIFSIFYTLQINAQSQIFYSFEKIHSEYGYMVQLQDTSRIEMITNTLTTTIFIKTLHQNREIIVLADTPIIKVNEVGLKSKLFTTNQRNIPFQVDFLYTKNGMLSQITIIRGDIITCYIISPQNEWL